MSFAPVTDTDPAATLRHAVTGVVALPEDPDYARIMPWNVAVPVAPCAAASAHHIAASVRIAGLTGRGIGPLVRSIGLSSDFVRAFEVGTGGEMLRGSKSTLGIVTAVETELPPNYVVVQCISMDPTPKRCCGSGSGGVAR
jgi:hypothetical protein